MDSETVTFTVAQAAVKIIETKEDGSTKETYYDTWGGAISYLSYSDNNKFEGVEKAEIILLKDTEYTGAYIPSIGTAWNPFPKEILIRSQGERHKVDGKGQILIIGKGVKVSIQNVQLEGGIQVKDGATLTLDEKTEAAYSSVASVVQVNQATLILEGASVSCQVGSDSYAAVELTGSSTLYINKGTSISGKNKNPSNQVKVTGTDNTVLLEKESTVPVFYGTGALTVYCNNDKYTETAAYLANVKGDRNIWCPITLPQGITLPADGENATNVTTRDNTTYGLADKNGSKAQTIKVPGEICSYQTEGGSPTPIETENLSFTMPCAAVTLNTHKTDDYGYCSNCGRTDLATAYQNGHLAIEGLTGRTYDSYPQVMKGITLDTANGTKTLTGPAYKEGKELAQDSTDPANADITNADYTVVYTNNIAQSSASAPNAPTATICGRGDYFGTVEYRFEIGAGMTMVSGLTATKMVYDGKEHTALENSDALHAVLRADSYDAKTGIKVADNTIEPCVGKTVAKDGFDSEYADKFPWQVICIADGKQYEGADSYTITDAGEYPFSITVAATYTIASATYLTAVIEPRNLTDSNIHLDDPDITVYYTGKPIIPENWDRGITDSNRKGEPNNDQGVLDKGKDFTVSVENNTEVTNGKKGGKITFTGIGNYTGELVRTFYIDYAFTLKQTTVSKDKWYNGDSNWT